MIGIKLRVDNTSGKLRAGTYGEVRFLPGTS